jgi:hypothetical protein
VVAQTQLQGLEAFPGPEDFERGQAIGIAKQGQGTPDCGVFICVFGKLLDEGHKNPNFMQEDIRFYRRKIAQILVRFGLNGILKKSFVYLIGEKLVKKPKKRAKIP